MEKSNSNERNWDAIVQPFARPYESWIYRSATSEELAAHMTAGEFLIEVKDRMVARVTDEVEAAYCLAMRGGIDIGLENHIESVLRSDPTFAGWRAAMPTVVPLDIAVYKHDYENSCLGKVNHSIREVGTTIGVGQRLFHGGYLPFDGNGELPLSRPLSTTFCPQVALRSAEWRGKAFDSNGVWLYLVRIVASENFAFVFDPDAAELGNEKELLFSAGPTLRLRSTSTLRKSYEVRKMIDLRMHAKDVPFHLCEVDLC